MKKSKVTDQAADGQKGIRKKSKVAGVMITQFEAELPEGKTTPDFSRKPIAITIQEGKSTYFKAIVVGNPKPSVTWTRANGEIVFHPDTCRQMYNESSHEHTLEFPKVAPEDADTYKCYATNDYGRAVCTAVLNVIEVGFCKAKELQKTYGDDIPDFLRKKLKKCTIEVGVQDDKMATPEAKIWEILKNADKKDYERICAEYGYTNFRGMLKKLKQMKQEEEGMDIAEESERFAFDDEVRHSLIQVDKKYDGGLYTKGEEGASVFTANFKVPEVDFALKIQEVKADERQDALFTCVLTAPQNEIKWLGKNEPLSNSEKFEITVSEDELIHKLMVRDCSPSDAGIYAAVAGIKSCNAWLLVEEDKEASSIGKEPARKNTLAGVDDDADLLRIAKEQQERYQKEMEENLRKAQLERDAAEEAARLKAQAARKQSVEAQAAGKQSVEPQAARKQSVEAQAARKQSVEAPAPRKQSVEAPAPRKQSVEAKSEAKVAAKAPAGAKKVEAVAEEPARRASIKEQRSSSIVADVHVADPIEDNEEIEENSLFMESVEVDKVTVGDGPPTQDIGKGNDQVQRNAQPKSEKSGKKEKHPKVTASQIADDKDTAVGNDHGDEMAKQKDEKSETTQKCPKVNIPDDGDIAVGKKGNDHGDEMAKQKGENSGTTEKCLKVNIPDAGDAAVAKKGNDHAEETAEQNSEISGTKENNPKKKIGDIKDADVGKDKVDESEEEEDEQPAAGKRVRVRQGPLIEETIIVSRQECISPLTALEIC